MMRVFLLLLCCSYTSFSWAQAHLTTPLEMLTFMEASPTQYEFEQLFGTLPERRRHVLPLGTHLVVVDNKEYQTTYQAALSTPDSLLLVQTTGLLNTERPKYSKIRRTYQQLLKRYPESGLLHTLVGSTYYEEQQYAKANSWLERALALNPIDYRAMWLQGELFLAQGQTDTALYTLTLAHLYNRNHKRLLQRVIQVSQQQGYAYYRNWGFDPRVMVYQDGDRVVINSDGIWLTYGIYKAVWAYDSDYQYIKSQQEVTDYLFHQELEAVVGTYMTYTELKHIDTRNYPAMNALGISLDKGLLEAFVFYEIMLVDKPELAYHLTPEFRDRLVTYIRTIRSKDYVIDDE